MKTIKLLFFLAFTTLAFNSCSDENPIENPNSSVAQPSIALRTVLNQLKEENNLNGRIDVFCFQFVYPITFEFNNGTSVTVANFEGLLEILANESPALYLEGIVFPFQIMQGGAVSTIDNEAEFSSLIEDCGFVSYNDDLSNSYCFDFVFPITVGGGGLPNTTISSNEELNAYIIANPNTGVNIIFPISVVFNNSTIEINSIYEFYEMLNNCNSCPCADDLNPVCVESPSGTIIEFPNMCNAECAGYTQSDLVPCNVSSGCTIGNVVFTTGACNADGSYPLTINFSYTNPGSTQFEVYNSSEVLVGTYNLSDLPITISSYPDGNFSYDHVRISIVGNPNCSILEQWLTPVCGNCGCPTNMNPVCVQNANGEQIQFDNECLAACAGYTTIMSGPCQPSYNFATLLGTCFNISYPAVVMYQGAVYTVNSNAELMLYWSPAIGPMPNFVYPITVTFNNVPSPVTIQSQAQFESQISQSCQ
ncbi:MAG TPA: hypothetical protein VGB43_00265 [Flavobacterium sp.]|jgi:hypothetical protein